jgi:RHS repeat-associated protein
LLPARALPSPRMHWRNRRRIRRRASGRSVYNYLRDYDPALGRYIESDPIGLAGGSFSTYAYANANPVSLIDPYGLWGFGVSAGGSVEGGGYGSGVAATGSFGGGLFFNGLSPSAGGFLSYGAFGGGPSGNRSVINCPDKNNWAAGSYGGGGLGVFGTNASNVSDLSGPFKTYSLNFGFGPMNVNLQFSIGSNAAGQTIWYANYGGPLGFPSGFGFGASLSKFNTNTKTTNGGGGTSGCGCQ